jgi:hypothetical protein
MTDNISAHDISARESKYKLWTAIITFLGVFAGFGVTIFQLYHQSGDLSQIEQNISQLRKSLKKPLEGVWYFKNDYSIYFGEKTPKRFMHGIAIFVWDDDIELRPGYHIFIGGGVDDF